MFEKFGKIEEKINALIQRVVDFIIMILSKIIPQKYRDLAKAIFQKFNKRIQKFQNKLSKYIDKSIEKFKEKKQAASVKAQKIKQLQYIEIGKDLVSPGGAKSKVSFIGKLFKRGFDGIEKKASNFGPAQLTMAFVATVVITFGLISVVSGTKKIVEMENPDRAPASVQEYKYSPKYRLFVKRTMKVMNVKIPIYRESVKEVRSVTVDFTVRTTTRFAKKYLEHYETQLKDYFFTHTEPVISSFPIEKEGKEVFKEKIAIDLNNFLKENNVEGEVEEVGVSFIIAN
jgi:hypothetical protein